MKTKQHRDGIWWWLSALVWVLLWAWQALDHWRYGRVCDLICPLFVDAEWAAAIREHSDWQSPLLVAVLVPLAAGVLALIVRRWGR